MRLVSSNAVRLGLLLLVSLWFALPARSALELPTEQSQPGEERGLIALDQALRELANPFTVMSVAAHLDDVDYGALALCRKKLGARAVIVLATRRRHADDEWLTEHSRVQVTREAVGAARVVGADLYFLDLDGPGESMQVDEAPRGWKGDEALSSLVRALRLLRPDVIITNHDAKTDAGSHREVARLLDAAYDASVDDKRFPALGTAPWQVRRLFVRTAADGADIALDLNEIDHVRGRTYAEMADAATGSTGRAPSGLDKSHYKLLRSGGDKQRRGTSLLDGLTLEQNVARAVEPPRVGDRALPDALASREALIDALIEKLLEKRLEGSVDELAARYKQEFSRVVRFTEALERAIALALGLELRVVIDDKTMVAGQRLTGRALFRNASARALSALFHAPESLQQVGPRRYKSSEPFAVGPGEVVTHELECELTWETTPTLSGDGHLSRHHYYPVGSALPGALPEEPLGDQVIVQAEVSVGQATINLAAAAAFDVAPPIELSVNPAAGLVRNWSTRQDAEFTVRLRNRTRGPLNVALWVVPLAITDDSYAPGPVNFAREDEEISLKLKLKLPILAPPLSPDVLIELRRPEPAPPDPIASTKIAVKAMECDVAPGLTVGVLGARDSVVAMALRQLGVPVEDLDADAIRAAHSATSPLACADLTRFDTIIFEEAAASVSLGTCLLEYARKGGNLVVLKQRGESLWPAPFAIELSSVRQLLANLSVKVLDPSHTLLSKPNRITQRDVEGLLVGGVMSVGVEWSREYSSLVSVLESGKGDQPSGLLSARVGDGTYAYCGFDMRRALSSLNEGGYRLLANLVSLPKLIKQRPKSWENWDHGQGKR